MALYEIKNIVANPFRHIERYPIKREKVVALRESLRKTGFWDNVVARARDGKAEIAYGHHRLVALKEEYGPKHTVELIIRKLDDEAMIQIMARENMEEWGSSLTIEQETIRAVVEAYGSDKINLLVPAKSSKLEYLRNAPSFSPGVKEGEIATHPYNIQTLAEFIGWDETKVQFALHALSFIEQGILRESEFDGLSASEARSLLEETRRAIERRNVEVRAHQKQAKEAAEEAKRAAKWREEAKREQERLEREAAKARDEKARDKALKEAAVKVTEQLEAQKAVKIATAREHRETEKAEAKQIEGRKHAVKIGRAVSSSFKRGEIGYKQAREFASTFEPKRDQPRPDIEDFTQKLATELSAILDPNRDPRAIKLAEIIRFQEHLSELTRVDLGRTLEGISRRALAFKDQLSANRALPAKRS